MIIFGFHSEKSKITQYNVQFDGRRVHRRAIFDVEVDNLLDRVRRHIRTINEDNGLTPDDKKQLKAYYLEHLTTPRAKELLQIYFPEDFPDAERQNKNSKPPRSAMP